MNRPTMLSMPAISGGRPATVTPNTTSSRPVSRPSSIAHGALDVGVERQAACPRQRPAARRSALAGAHLHPLGGHRCARPRLAASSVAVLAADKARSRPPPSRRS